METLRKYFAGSFVFTALMLAFGYWLQGWKGVAICAILGVLETSPNVPMRRIDDWASLRTSRLTQRLLAEEFDRQVLSDGGHVSRHPWVTVELLLDLLPLRACFPARERTIDPRISDAMERMMGMLQHLRLGDGALARFNGMGASEHGALATVLGYSVGGDVESLADFIQGWLKRNDRLASPKMIAGESYGGFRAPRIAHFLQRQRGVGINAMVLISPVLDFESRRGAGTTFFFEMRAS